jgi:flagellar transcriptional activator FlhC
MRARSVVSDARGVQRAFELINLGARLQLLEAETELSRERLLRLYKEVKGVSPPRGMLPFSTEWFLTWQPNIHASVFINIHRYLLANTDVRGIDALTRSYPLYIEHVRANGLERVLSLTRAWTLVRFFESKMLRTVACTSCKGHYVAHGLDLAVDYVCGLCRVPSRAGKGRKARPAALPTH